MTNARNPVTTTNAIGGELKTSDKQAITRLYNALVSKDFKTPVDFELIVSKGFPAFEKTLGRNDWNKLKKSFGIGVKKPVAFKPTEINLLLSKLRTIENAECYIPSFKEMLVNLASLLEGAPKSMGYMERAKLLRMYFNIFCGYYCFNEDLHIFEVDGEEPRAIADQTIALANNPKDFFPEQTFFVYDIKKIYGKKSVFYEAICFELSKLDKRTLRKVLNFAELEFDGETFKSVNIPSSAHTFGEVRKIKYEVHKEPGVYPMELFSTKPMIENFYIEDIYRVYKWLKVIPLEEFVNFEDSLYILEGSRIVKKSHKCYSITDGLTIAGEVEAQRFIQMLDLASFKKLKLKSRKDDKAKCDISLYTAAIRFLYSFGFLKEGTDPLVDLQFAEKLINEDTDDVLKKYSNFEVSEKEVRESFGKKLAKILGKEKTPQEILADIAEEYGYGYIELYDDPDEADLKLLNVLISGNEKFLEKIDSSPISKEAFECQMGIPDGFAEMFFFRDKIDISAIEAKLMEFKHGNHKNIKQYNLLIKLYCYIVENEVPCGPKGKVPKRNKSLKPAILKKLVA